ncbi:MAG: TIGR03032 family protein [Acidobacteria bacterium]|nr:TIGR03032 family protein [Acidobacteriota bacterium]
MKRPTEPDMEALWQRHNALWRDPAQIASHWQGAGELDARLLNHQTKGDWWQVLSELDATLLVTREYEHLLMALSVKEGRAHVSYLPLPHPSGLAVDHKRNIVHVVSTRNPNQVYDLAPVERLTPRADVEMENLEGRPLVPVRSRFLPGSLYIHDLALIGGELYANAVGQNAVVRLDESGAFKRVWWPRAIETSDGPVFDRNLIQLNSIAAGVDIRSSYFTASADRISNRRPGHRNFPVDKRGVIFSGRTREPVAHGLTRPHSARLLNSTLWVDNSGYGEFGRVERGEFEVVTKLPGWTRGLCFKGRIAFVGTSRVIPRFRQYAPGLEVESSVCGVHAVDTESGRVLGSISWPHGNQIFAIEWIKHRAATGLPFIKGRRRVRASERLLFYAYQTKAL